MDEVLRELLPGFITEAGDLLNKSGQQLRALEQNPNDMAVLNDLFRGAHTLKGSAGIFGYNHLSQLAQRLANILDTLRKDEAQVDLPVCAALVRAFDVLKEMLDDVRSGEVKPEYDYAGVLADLEAAVGRNATVVPVKRTAKKSTARSAKTKDPVADALETVPAPVAPAPVPAPETAAASSSAPPDAVAPGTTDTEMDEMLKSILPDFINEAQELLEKLDQNFMELEKRPDDPALLNEIFRAAHTIKGSSGLFGFKVLSEMAHAMENVLDKLRKNELAVNPHITDLLLAGVDQLKAMLHNIQQQGAPGAHDIGQLVQQLHDCEHGTAAPVAPVPAAPPAPAATVTAPPPTAPMPDDAAPEEEMDEMFKAILPDFINEAQELLEKLDQNFMELEKRPADPDLLNEIFRAAHTIKGSSSLFGFKKLSELAHAMENVLDKLRKNELAVSRHITDLLLAGVDKLKVMLHHIRQQGTLGVHDIAQLVQQLHDSERGETAPAASAAPAPAAGPGGSIIKQIRAQAAQNRQSGAPEPVPATPTAPAAPVAAPKSGIMFKEVTAPKPDAAAQNGRADIKVADQTIRVNVDRLDNLMNLAGELILGRNRLIQISKDLKNRWQSDRDVEQLTDLSAQIDLLTTDIQIAIMKTRMLAIQHVFNKFPRMIRDLSRQKNKLINLEISGEETELDKSVLEDINDPLVHIIRNSIDHGIESPEDRRQAGKPETGTIKLAAYHEGNHIVIRVEDDGKGINVEKVGRKAVEKGLLKPEELERISQREIINLIFMPGFSTADQVSEISGRGVGMDVVRTNIDKMKGTIDVQTEPGKGTVMHIKIPLTLAIIQSLLVKVSSEIYAIPVLSVTEIVRLNTSEVDTICGREVVRLRNEVYPIIRLAKLFDLEIEQHENNTQYIVMVALAEQKFGLVVDRIIGEQEVVVKPLGSYLGKSLGLAGASIMGDGRVCLILDISTLSDLIYEEARKAS